MHYTRFVKSRINPALSPRDGMGSAFLGLVCEAGEAGDVIKKHMYQGQALDRDKVIAELGDVRFYLEWCCLILGISIQDVEEANVLKLEKRYVSGFVPNVDRSGE